MPTASRLDLARIMLSSSLYAFPLFKLIWHTLCLRFRSGVDTVLFTACTMLQLRSHFKLFPQQNMKILDVPQSGSVAGVTSSRNRFGQYRRTRAQPTNPNTTFQAVARARLQTNSDAWKLLTANQRQGWADLGNQFSRSDTLGQAYNLTGFQAYCSVNGNNLAAGNVVVTDAPIFQLPAPLVTVVPTITAASFSVAYTATPLGAGERIFISASPQRSAGRTFEGDFRLIFVSAAAAASPSVILSGYSARFGAPATGARIFVSVQRYSLGFLSTSINTSAVVA